VTGKMQILGVGIDAYPLDDLLARIDEILRGEQRAVIGYVNAHALNLAYKDARFRHFLNAAEIVFCDGFGVRIAAWLLGYPMPPRYTPPDWIKQLAQICAQRSYSMYFVGAQPGVAEKAAILLRETYPGLNICGVQHGYFDKSPYSTENARVVAEINRLVPQILVVGLGMPAQEYWIEDHWAELKVNIALPVGAMFDYISGEMQRAPRWMTDHGLEWLGRLMIEPRRLWRRYLLGNPRFIYLILREFILEKVGKKKQQEC
jgi:N-acetylglucosaminyldiphosphoundecaprenol N-acetyl-beta-D-mannosaminyltransferase